MEGAWLDQNCSTKLTTDGYEWSTSISLSYISTEVKAAPVLSKGFHWDKSLLAPRLAEVQKTTVLQVLPQYHYADKWVAVYGRLETRFPVDGMLPPLRLPNGLEVPRIPVAGHPAGFGHLNGSLAQIVWPQKGIYRFPQKE